MQRFPRLYWPKLMCLLATVKSCVEILAHICKEYQNVCLYTVKVSNQSLGLFDVSACVTPHFTVETCYWILWSAGGILSYLKMCFCTPTSNKDGISMQKFLINLLVY